MFKNAKVIVKIIVPLIITILVLVFLYYLLIDFSRPSERQIGLVTNSLIIAALATGYVISTSMFSLIITRKHKLFNLDSLPSPRQKDLSDDVESMKKEIRQLMKKEIRQLLSSIKIDTALTASNILEAQVQELEQNQQKIDSELKALKKLLFDNPEASITMPLLTKDVTNMKDEIKRVNSNTKWFLVMILTLAIGLGSILVGILAK